MTRGSGISFASYKRRNRDILLVTGVIFGNDVIVYASTSIS